MPANPTPLELLWLDMHMARARYTQVLTMVEALGIANGDPAPLDFYRLVTDDPEYARNEAKLNAFARGIMS